MATRARIEGGKLIVEIDIEGEPVPSASGKTLIVASSHGNIATMAVVDGKNVVVGVNAFIGR